MDDPVLNTMRRRRNTATIINSQTDTTTTQSLTTQAAPNQLYDSLKNLFGLFKSQSQMLIEAQVKIDQLERRLDSVDTTIIKIGDLSK